MLCSQTAFTMWRALQSLKRSSKYPPGGSVWPLKAQTLQDPTALLLRGWTSTSVQNVYSTLDSHWFSIPRWKQHSLNRKKIILTQNVEEHVSLYQPSSSQVLLQPDHFLYYIAGRWFVTSFYFSFCWFVLNNLGVKFLFSFKFVGCSFGILVFQLLNTNCMLKVLWLHICICLYSETYSQ